MPMLLSALSGHFIKYRYLRHLPGFSRDAGLVAHLLPAAVPGELKPPAGELNGFRQGPGPRAARRGSNEARRKHVFWVVPQGSGKAAPGSPPAGADAITRKMTPTAKARIPSVGEQFVR